MASGGKRRGGGERVLEGRHVIGLFMLMLLFSRLFPGLRRTTNMTPRRCDYPAWSLARDILPKSEVTPKPSSKQVVLRRDDGWHLKFEWEFITPAIPARRMTACLK
jgi:hypothetical protein